MRVEPVHVGGKVKRGRRWELLDWGSFSLAKLQMLLWSTDTVAPTSGLNKQDYFDWILLLFDSRWCRPSGNVGRSIEFPGCIKTQETVAPRQNWFQQRSASPEREQRPQTIHVSSLVRSADSLNPHTLCWVLAARWVAFILKARNKGSRSSWRKRYQNDMWVWNSRDYF